VNGPEPPPLAIEEEIAEISGFWRRVLALLIDGLVLGLPAFLLGLVLFDQFARLGGWGRAVGFFVALFYFGFLNSAVAGGQTVGKRLANIRVVDSNGSLIPLGRSLARYCILGLPYFLNGAPIPSRFLFGWMGILFGFVIFGIGFSIIYLIIFNRRNRQSLHDLTLGTYVTKAQSEGRIAQPKAWPGHYIVVALIFAASILVPFATRSFAEKPPFKDLLTLQTRIVDQPDVSHATAFSGTTSFSDASGRRSIIALAVTAYTDRRINDPEAFADRLARVILETYPEAARKDQLRLNLIYGYDIGIASGSVGHNYIFSPAEWQQRVQSRAGSNQ
jgi:uncharacterized RDD family membrane protein YckC